MDKRGIQGGDQWRTQDSDEIITRTLDVSDVGSAAGAVTNPTMEVWTCPTPTGTAPCGAGAANVTVAVTAGALGVAGQIITMLTLQTLVAGTNYSIGVGYDKDGNTLENRFYIACPDEEP